jgi:very-short-patch-repair endonuclease
LHTSVCQTVRDPSHGAWELARRQHGVISRQQLWRLGFSRRAIQHRIATGRLHPVYAGVYAVGRPDLTREGRWMAAVLACGQGALISHLTAAFHWGLIGRVTQALHVSVPVNRRPRRPGIVTHRRANLAAHATTRHRIPITTPARTLVDIATDDRLEEAINAADRLGLIDPERLRRALDTDLKGEDGAPLVRRTLDRHTRTDSHRERRFLLIARRSGLPEPLTQQLVRGHRVDFLFREHALVVETDGLRYHRTPAQQAKDRRRDQDLLMAGLTPLRFTHAQVVDDPAHVEAVLRGFA